MTGVEARWRSWSVRHATWIVTTAIVALAGCSASRVESPNLRDVDTQREPRLYLGAQPLHERVRAVTLLPRERLRILNLPPGSGKIVPPAAVTRGSEEVFTLVVTEGTKFETTGGTLMRGRRTRRPLAYVAPPRSGTYRLRLHLGGTATDFTVLVLTPFTHKRNGELAGYRIGNYPEENGQYPHTSSARPLRGFVEVTKANEELLLSSHLRMKHLLCKQQPDHDPKYLMVDVRLVDKLEHLVDRLRRAGFPATRLTVMSGYRTPHYNRQIGNETVWSRHTVGDAADVFVNEDGDGRMDDLDGDGDVTIDDARVLLTMVEELDADPLLAGGASAYPATPQHGPFVHVDARGYRARW